MNIKTHRAIKRHTEGKVMAVHLYEHIVDKIETLIKEQTLHPGDRVPSLRKLSVQERVSISTVLQAYFTLEDRGLIEARPQSGYYVHHKPVQFPSEPKISRPADSATRVNVSDFVMNMHEVLDAHDAVPFGTATPDPRLLPIRKLNRISSSITRREGNLCHTYDFTQGNETLRRHIARRSVEGGCRLTPDDIVITYGCTEALHLCLRAVAQPGDTIAVESPTYFGFLQLIESLNMKALEIPTHPRDGISLDALEHSLGKYSVKACLITPNYQNPIGSCMPETNKKQLVQLLSRRGIPLIEDDIFGDLHFGIQRPRLCKSFDEHELVLTCTSFSKTLSPGFRIGWTAPGRFKSSVQRLRVTSTLTGSVLPQLTIAEMLSNGAYDHHLRKIRRSYESQIHHVTNAISKYFPAGTNATRPEGGFLLWVELPAGTDTIELHRKALEKGISIMPGAVFSAKRQYKNFIRLNCSNLWSEQLHDALITLGRLAGRT